MCLPYYTIQDCHGLILFSHTTAAASTTAKFRQESHLGCFNTLAIFYLMFNLLFSIYFNIRKLLDDGVVGDFWSQQMVTKTWSLPKGQLLQLLKLYSSNHLTHYITAYIRCSMIILLLFYNVCFINCQKNTFTIRSYL